MSSENKLKQIVEASLLAAGEPLSVDRLLELFPEDEQPERKALREAIKSLQEDFEGHGIELTEVGGGFRFNVRSELSPWVSRLWEERPARYSRALLETLALIAYRQPITRGEIEDIRGVSVSTNIMKTLLEREWVRVVGQRDVPGKPSLYATTREFLNYFGLKSLDQLPTLQEIRDLDSINRELELEDKVTPINGDEQPSAKGEVPEQPEGDQAVEGEMQEAVEQVEETSESNAAGEEISSSIEDETRPEGEEPESVVEPETNDDAAPVLRVVADNAEPELPVEATQSDVVDESADLAQIIEKHLEEEPVNE